MAASPSTLFVPAELVITAPVKVAVPLACVPTMPDEIVLPGVEEKASPLSVVEPGVRKGSAMLELDLLNTVMTELTVDPAFAVVVGGVMAVISSEKRFSVLPAAIAPDDVPRVDRKSVV